MDGQLDKETTELNNGDNPLKEYLAYTLEEKKSGKVVGSVGCSYYDDLDTVGICYFIGAEYRNHGYATQATDSYVQYYFNNYDLSEIIATIKDSNVASWKVAEKSGFDLIDTRMYKDINDECEELYRFYRRNKMKYKTRVITIEDYDDILRLWNSTEQTRRAMNPVDDTREGIDRYLKRNPNTCFAAIADGEIVGVILTGHDGRRGIVHHMCVREDYRRMGIAERLVSLAEETLKSEGIQKVFCLVFKDNDPANAFWEEQGYSLRTNLNYRNKSLNEDIPAGK